MEKLEPFKFKAFREIYDLADYCNKIVDRQNRIVEAIKYLAKEVDHLGDRAMGIEKSWGNMSQVKINEILEE